MLDQRPAEATDAQIKQLFDRLGVSQLRDASQQHTRVFDPMPRRRTADLRLAGPAFPVATDNDMLPCIQALEAAPTGSVLYFHNLGHPSEALAGDILATAAKAQGLAGLVVTGAVRDLDTLAEVGLPVFSTAVCYASAKTARVPAATLPAPVSTDTFTVRPGDWLFGDGDGVVLVEQEWLRSVLTAATMLQRTEDELKSKLVGGARFAALCGLDDFLSGSGPLRFDGACPVVRRS